MQNGQIRKQIRGYVGWGGSGMGMGKGREWGLTVNGISLMQDENFLKLDYGVGCTTL